MLEARAAAMLNDLERRLDAGAFRTAARLAARWHARQRAPAGPAHDFRGSMTDEVLPALRQAMALGALESAEHLVERALAAPQLVERADVGARALVLETLLMLGRRDEARVLAEPWQPGLLRSVSGCAMLELLGMSAPERLPDGRPHLLRLSRLLERGQLDAAGVLRVLGSAPFPFLRSPELHLLLFSALLADEPERALAFLNRFLGLHGSPRAHLRSDKGNVLDRLSFESAATVVGATPLVSVLVPAHNAAATVGYAVDSLLNQSYRALEVLVGDDASDDATLSILRQRARADSRLRLFRSLRNQGPYNVKNALAQHARGELLTFHDADDLALPDRITRQVEAMQSPGTVASIANFARIRPSGSFVFFKDQRASRLGMVTLMLTRQAFGTVGPFRSVRVGADLELYAALRSRFGAGAIARLRSPIMLGLWSGSSATLTAGSESLEDGYRSPARRAYSQVVFEMPASASDVNQRMRATGNHIDAADVDEVLSPVLPCDA